MLDIGDTERAMLRASCALTLDDAGNEGLTGLTVEESQFVLGVEQKGKESLSPTQRQHHLALMLRHRGARIMAAAQASRRGQPPHRKHH